jgi:filamentous hemagglutinin
MALLNAKNPEDYALALLSTLPVERALALIGKFAKAAPKTGVFNIAERVYDQLNDPRLGSLSGEFNAADLQKLVNNPDAVRVYDARSGHINVIQTVDGKLLRITVPNNEMKIISVGPIRPNQVKNLIEKGSFVPLP